MPSYKVTYFNFMGLAEPIRFLLCYGNIEFEDKRVDYNSDEWKNLKSSMPLGQLPVLEIDGKKSYQHLAICRFLGKKVGLNGKDDWEDLQIDIIADTLNDIRLKISSAYMDIRREQPNATPEEMLKHPKYFETVKLVQPHWEKLDAVVKQNNGYFANKKLSWVDLYFAASVRLLDTCEKEKYKNLQQLEQKVLAIPAIKKWVENRPVTPF